jgi:hypothetical protein
MFDPAGDGKVRQAVHFRQLARSHCLGKNHAFNPLSLFQCRSLKFWLFESKNVEFSVVYSVWCSEYPCLKAI